jgi:UDP-N-acetylglucosamine 1-carboxyvinyltransferase
MLENYDFIVIRVEPSLNSDVISIKGGSSLFGDMTPQGAKNAALLLMCAACLTNDSVKLMNVPNISDARTLRDILLGLCEQNSLNNKSNTNARIVDFDEVISESDSIEFSLSGLKHCNNVVLYRSNELRASILLLGVALGRGGALIMPMPGGCNLNLGNRSIDMHLEAFALMGAKCTTLMFSNIKSEFPEINIDSIAENNEFQLYIHVTSGGERLNGISYNFHNVSVTATANVMIAASLANGVTILTNAACEPEIVDLANMLNKMGAKIACAGSQKITITGVNHLHGAEYTVMPDRIEAGTYMIATALCGGEMNYNINANLLVALLCKLDDMGVSISLSNGDKKTSFRSVINEFLLNGTNYSQASDAELGKLSVVLEEYDQINIKRDKNIRLKAVNITTNPHPMFPTDLQPQFAVLNCLADGNSNILENLYDNRVLHVAELQKMSALISYNGTITEIQGIQSLNGAVVIASDLRCAAALLLAGLVAKGDTSVSGLKYLIRGYTNIIKKLNAFAVN